MPDAREESSEDFSDSTSSDNFSIYTETSSSEEDLQNVEEPGTSTSSATTHNSRKGKSKSSSKQPTVKRSKRQQSFFAGKAYLKVNSLVKTPLHEFMAVARVWIRKTTSLCVYHAFFYIFSLPSLLYDFLFHFLNFDTSVLGIQLQKIHVELAQHLTS